MSVHFEEWVREWSVRRYLGPIMGPELLRVMKIAPDGTVSLVETTAGDYDPDTQSLSVSVAEFPGDFMVLLADDPCATASPCDAKAIPSPATRVILTRLEAREAYQTVLLPKVVKGRLQWHKHCTE